MAQVKGSSMPSLFKLCLEGCKLILIFVLSRSVVNWIADLKFLQRRLDYPKSAGALVRLSEGD